MPFGNDSFKHPFVDLLSVEQALADYAVLMTALKAQLNASKSRVIAFGGRLVCCYCLSCFCYFAGHLLPGCVCWLAADKF